MNVYAFFIQRPVFSTVLSLLVILVGLASYQRLAVREYPNIDEPVVSVTTTYPGASAEIIESQVTQVLEGSIAGIEGIETLVSSSRQERSRITVTFRLETDPDVAASDVRDRVGRVRGRLPDEIEEPIIAKVEADAQPILYIAFSSDRHSALDVTDYADRYVKDRLQNLPGVAEVQILGERRYAMRIWIDHLRLAAYGLTVQDVEEALRRQNVEVPAGRIEGLDREFTVLSRTGLTTPEQFERIIIKDADGFPVRLSDVGRAELGAREERRATRFNGAGAIALGVVKQATANPLDVSNAVRAALPQLVDELPEGMDAQIAYDTSVFIDRSIAEVFKTIGEAVVLVVLVIFFFLRTIRATIIPLITIPVALVGAFAIMYALGFTVNTLTLMAMTLAIGLVVDDAIVVLENIYRHIEEGMAPVRAAIQGMSEIATAVIAMTLTLAAVYAPVAFAPGRTGKLFTEFALSLAGAVLVSGFVALTLTPMMSSRLLRRQPSHGRVFNLLERGFEATTTGYRRLLTRSLRVPLVIVVIGSLTAAASYVLFTNLKSELSPTEDRGVIRVVGLGPEGATLDYTSRYAQQFEDIFRAVPEVSGYFVVAGVPEVNQAIGFGRLKPWEGRDRKQQDIGADLQAEFSRIAGLQVFTTNPPSLGASSRSRPIEYVIQTSGTYQDLEGHVERMLERIRDNPGLTNVDSDLKLNKPQVEIAINREKAADVGVPVETIGRTLETLLGGRQVTRFNRDGEQYDVVVQLAEADRRTPETLSTIYVRGRGGAIVQLANLVAIQETVAPKELNRFNQLRAAKIEANLAPGYTQGEALDYLDGLAAEVLPAGVQTDYAGQSREFKQSGSSLYFVFILALGFIYLVLAAQFESFLDPFIIMLTVPLSMTGALLALYLTGGTLNVYSQIGLVTLVGLITKHGILIVQFANLLRAQGRNVRDAVVEAASLRLRPILMTTGAMVLGAAPLALATGAGAESRQQIGWVVVGGMLLGTLLTLFVVPTAYTLLAARRRVEREAPAEAAGAPAE